MLTVLVLAIGGCSRCGGSTIVSEAGAYARCRAGDPPEVAERLGPLAFRMRGRTLDVGGVRQPATLAVFAGPGPGPAPSAAALALLGKDRPDLLLVLGDLGDSEGTARATARALASTGVPALVVAGARDTPAGLAAVVESANGKVIDATSLDAVRIGNDTLVPLGGTRLGRQSPREDGCGFGPGDVEELTKALGPNKSGRRWLLAWQAPAGGVAAADGIDAGDAEVQRFAKAIGAAGGLFAWPPLQAGRAFAAEHGTRLGPLAPPARDLQLVVPRLTPPALEREDGSRLLPGYALLRLDRDGMQLVAIREAPVR